MRLMLDAVFDYRGYHGCPSTCRLRIFEPDTEAEKEKPLVVIATELESNLGTSITNAAERIATAVWKLLERPENGMTWIQHYADRAFLGGRPQLKEEFDLVEFTLTPCQAFAHPKWRPTTKTDVETIIGQELGP